jgi:heat-inducible transcriptional repressor
VDDRKAEVLRAIIEEYVETGQPVGSQTVAERRALGVSSATVRNDMTLLEREGYVTHPHTSAGRIPTDKGYRYFVDNFTRTGTLRPSERMQVSEFFASAHRALEEMLHETSLLLSRLTSHAAVVVGPHAEAASIRSVQVVPLHRGVVMAVAVLSNGAIEKEVFSLDLELDDARIGAASAHLTTHLRDASLADLPDLTSTGDPITDALAMSAREAFAGRARPGRAEHIFVGGTGRLAVEYGAEAETTARLLEVLEQQYVVVTLVRDLLDRGVTVRIGAENQLEELRDCTVVLAPYDVEGQMAGTVGVLGPTRMDYPQAMAAVAVVSRNLSRHLTPE